MLYQRQGRNAEAEPLFTRALALSSLGLPAAHPDTTLVLGNLAGLLALTKREPEALRLMQTATANVIERGSTASHAVSSNSSEITRNRDTFARHVGTAYRVAEQDPTLAAILRDEGFRMAQWASETEAGRAVARMGARFAASDTALGRLAHERQDLEHAWTAADKRLSAALALVGEARAGSDVAARARMVEIEARIAQIDRRLQADFPGYFALVRPDPLSPGQAAGLLGGDEALVFWLTADDATFVFAVTREGTAWHRLDITAADLAAQVTAFRGGSTSRIRAPNWLPAAASISDGQRPCTRSCSGPSMPTSGPRRT